jgi:holo-[acyl-carrier protein] synthase
MNDLLASAANVIGVGIDIIDVERIRNLGDERMARIFTSAESVYCRSFPDPWPHFAARFAAKEAVVKAATSRARLTVKSSEVVMDEIGRPAIRLVKSNAALADVNFLCSLSHTDSQAIAIVLMTMQ